MTHEVKDRSQRLARCYAAWREVHGGSKPKRKRKK